MSASLESLATLPGVAGLCAHRGGEITWSRLPDSISMERAAALCAAVSSAFATYAGAGRQLREAWFEFPEFCVLALPGAGTEDAMLTFFLTGRSCAGTVTGAARSAAPVSV